MWTAIDGTRRVVFNLVFLLLVLLFLGALFGDSTPTIEGDTTLVLEPTGFVVEQFSTDPFERALAETTRREASLRRLMEASGELVLELLDPRGQHDPVRDLRVARRAFVAAGDQRSVSDVEGMLARLEGGEQSG